MEEERGFLEHPSFAEFSQGLFGQLLEATQKANNLPEGDDYAFYASFRSFRMRISGLSTKLLDLSQEFLQQQFPTNTPLVNDKIDPDDVIDRFAAVVDGIDTLLEKVDSFADEATGQGNQPKVMISQLSNVVADGKGREDYYLFHGSNILRPQLQFKDPVENSNQPWKPWVLRASTGVEVQTKQPAPMGDVRHHITTQLGIADACPEMISFPHPYEKEISSIEFRRDQLEPVVERRYKPLEDTPFTWIDTEEKLTQLARTLDKQTEFAVDMEHHSYRSFQGFVCLMQISTRSEDFIIDTLALRHHMHILGSSFHNPNIVKVYHGGDMDVLWQQKDFGLYIFNMFDTGQAARVLEFPSFALAYLLKLFCNVSVDKKYQLADWRIRPLPEEMLRYAREDTHYLLYIYDRLRNELIGRGNMTNNLLLAVLNRSRDICLQRYEKELWTPTAHLTLFNRYNFVFNAKQMAAFAALFKWRDTVAREEDESTRYVLPNHMLFHISEVLPSDVPQLLACCNPVPPLIRLHADTLVDIVQLAASSDSQAPIPTLPHHRPLLRPNNPIERFQPVQMKESVTGLSIKNSPSQETPQPASPVLTKEQLYITAGWQEMLPESPRSRRAVISANPNTPASALFKSFTQPSVQPNEAESHTVQLIHSSISKQGLYPTTVVFQEAPTSTVPLADARENDDPVMQDVPRSIEEIYKISNRNRKRNKEKRKLKEESTRDGEKDFSPVKLGQDDEQTSGDSVSHPTKRQKTDDLSDREFMRSIGWTSPRGATPSSAVSLSSESQEKRSSGTKQRRASGVHAEGFTPFDYSSAPSPSPGFSSRGAPRGRAAGRSFNPYMNIDRQPRGQVVSRGRARGQMHSFGTQNDGQAASWPKR